MRSSDEERGYRRECETINWLDKIHGKAHANAFTFYVAVDNTTLLFALIRRHQSSPRQGSFQTRNCVHSARSVCFAAEMENSSPRFGQLLCVCVLVPLLKLLRKMTGKNYVTAPPFSRILVGLPVSVFLKVVGETVNSRR